MVPWLLHYLVNMTQTTFALAVQLKLLLRYQSIMIMDAFEYICMSVNCNFCSNQVIFLLLCMFSIQLSVTFSHLTENLHIFM